MHLSATAVGLDMRWQSFLVRELPLRCQLALFLPLQLAWLGAAALVALKAAANSQRGATFDSEPVVYTLAFLWLPLVLSLVGGLVLRRHERGSQTARADRVTYWVFVGLTSVNALVTLVAVLCGLPVLCLRGDIRE